MKLHHWSVGWLLQLPHWDESTWTVFYYVLSGRLQRVYSLTAAYSRFNALRLSETKSADALPQSAPDSHDQATEEHTEASLAWWVTSEALAPARSIMSLLGKILAAHPVAHLALLHIRKTSTVGLCGFGCTKARTNSAPQTVGEKTALYVPRGMRKSAQLKHPQITIKMTLLKSGTHTHTHTYSINRLWNICICTL